MFYCFDHRIKDIKADFSNFHQMTHGQSHVVKCANAQEVKIVDQMFEKVFNIFVLFEHIMRGGMLAL